MGLVSLGPPEEIVLNLARKHQAEIFVETGTYRGGTTRWAAKHFKSVYTIELAESIYNLHHKELSAIPGVKALFGDSREILPKILNEIGNQKCVFWLDGHWSGGETAGSNDECPLLDELKILSSRQDDIILIDDARLFLSAPPEHHNASVWPVITDVIDALRESGKKPFVQIIEDVIFALPDSKDLKEEMVKYSQKRSIPFWNRLSDKNFDFGKDDLRTKFLKIRDRLSKVRKH